MVAATVGPQPSRPGPGPAVVLLIEDEAPQAMAVATALRARGHRVEVAHTGGEGLDRVDALAPDVVLLDLGLPDMDGLLVCRHVLARSTCPVIVVSADAVEDRMVAALDLGASDYVVKPFGMEVLLARVRVALRGRERRGPEVEARWLESGDVRMDIEAHQVWFGGEPVELQARLFSLLALLLRNEGRLVTYSMMTRALWGFEPTDTYLNSLRMGVSKLRKELGTGPDRPTIDTEARLGYRLVGPGGIIAGTRPAPSG